jgi:hypothetical protein
MQENSRKSPTHGRADAIIIAAGVVIDVQPTSTSLEENREPQPNGYRAR